MITDILKRLTDNYIKKPISNTYKLIKLFSDELTEVRDNLELIEDWRDVEKAEGNTLDLLGADLGEARKSRNDSDYRNALLFAIIKNTSGGDIERLNEIFETAVPGFDSITEGFEFDSPMDTEPASILVKILAQETNNIPFHEVDSVTAGGVRSHFELIYGANIKAVSDFEASLDTPFDSEIEIESSFESTESERYFYEAGVLHAGETGVLP